MAVKYYAVAVGKKPGIYTKWDECKAMVHGFPGAVYKSFKTLEEAETFTGKRTGAWGRSSCKRSGAAEGNARSSTAEIRNSRRRQGRDERCGICRRDRGSAGELRVRGWLFSRRYRRVRLWRFFDSCRRKRSAAGCGEGAGDGIDAQCGRRGFREHGSHRKGARTWLKGSYDLLRLYGNRDVGKRTLEAQ